MREITQYIPKKSAFVPNTLLYTALKCTMRYSVLAKLCWILTLLSSLKVAPLLITLVAVCPAGQKKKKKHGSKESNDKSLADNTFF